MGSVIKIHLHRGRKIDVFGPNVGLMKYIKSIHIDSNGVKVTLAHANEDEKVSEVASEFEEFGAVVSITDVVKGVLSE